MNSLLVLALLLVVPQEAFTRFSYCRDTPRGTYESQCLYLNPDGSGEARIKRRRSDEVQQPISLSAAGRERFLAVIAGVNYLAGAANYESKRKVADLGRKRLVLEMPAGSRTAEFNYSDLKEVNALSTFFDALLNQQILMFDLESALRFERLTVPERLDQIENELRSNRVADPPGMIPLLEKVAGDQRVMNYARTQAKEMKDRLEAGKR
jgi:hypothetical protein